jgi:hypothetical protein
MPVILIAMETTPAWAFCNLNLSREVGYMLACVCGVLSGYCAGRIYGHRYYSVFMVGMCVAAVGGLTTADYILDNVNNISIKWLFLASIAGMLPGILLGRALKKVQDAIYPRTEEEIAEHEHIEEMHEQDKEVYFSMREIAGWSVFLCILAVVPPLGFLANWISYLNCQGKPDYVRRHAMLGMWLSGFILAGFLAIFAYLFTL